MNTTTAAKTSFEVRRYRLHPSIRVSAADQEKLRFSGPFRDILIKDDSGLLKRLLPALADPSKLELAIQDLDKEKPGVADEMIAALANVDLMIEMDTNIPVGSLDIVAHSIDVAARQVSRLRGYSRTGADQFVGKQVLVLGGPQSLLDAIGRLGMHPLPFEHIHEEGNTNFSVAIAWGSEADVSILAAYNEQAKHMGIPTLFVIMGRHKVTIGPVFIPGQSACLACMNERWRSNALHLVEGSDTFLLAGNNKPSKLTTLFAAQAAATRAAAMAAGLSHLAPPGEVVEMDLVSLHSRKGHVLRAPRCPVCSTEDISEFRAVRAASVE